MHILIDAISSETTDAHAALALIQPHVAPSLQPQIDILYAAFDHLNTLAKSFVTAGVVSIDVDEPEPEEEVHV